MRIRIELNKPFEHLSIFQKQESTSLIFELCLKLTNEFADLNSNPLLVFHLTS